MVLQDIDRLSRDMNFSPSTPWSPLLPAVAWRGTLIAGFEHEGMAVDHSDKEISSLFKELYSELNLIELAKIYRNWTLLVAHQKQEWLKFWPELQRHYHFKDNETFRSFLLTLLQTPFEFQEWLAAKKPSYKELSILSQLEDPCAFNKVLLQISDLKLSRSEATSLLELAIECFLIHDTPLEELEAQKSESKAQWMQRIKKLRFPNTNEIDTSKKEEIEKLSLPQFVQARWTRIGDEAGIELKFLAKNSKDLENKMQAVKRSSENIKAWQDL